MKKSKFLFLLSMHEKTTDGDTVNAQNGITTARRHFFITQVIYAKTFQVLAFFSYKIIL